MQLLLQVLKRKGFMMIRHIRFRPRLQNYKPFLCAAICWDVTQRVVVVHYRPYQSLPQGSRMWIVDPIV